MVASGGVATPTVAGGRSLEKTPGSAAKKQQSSTAGEPPSAALAAASTTPTTSASNSYRPPDTEDPLLESIASKQSALVQPIITLTCYIPTNKVGNCIGKRGATIAAIQRQAQQSGTSNGTVRLSIVGHQHEVAAAAALGTNTPRAIASPTSAAAGELQQQQQPPQSPDNSIEQSPTQQQQHPTTPLQSSGTSSVPYTYSELDWSSPLWTPVVIRADPLATLTAAQLLREKVGKIDDVVMDVPLGRAKHAAVVGRRGNVLANLSADTNVRIMVPRRDLRHDVIQLEGKLDNVKQCLERVLAAVASSENPVTATTTTGSSRKRGKESGGGCGGGGGGGGGGNRSKKMDKGEESTTASIIVTVNALPSQTKLRTISRKTDTIIKKKKVDENSWNLTISGSSPESVQSAWTLLKKWNEDNFNSNNSNNNASLTAGDGSNSNSNNNNGGTPSRGRGRGRQERRKRGGNRGRGNSNANSNSNANE